MKAKDVMVYPVITVKPYTLVGELAQLLLDKHVSAVPVVGDDDQLVGMVSEGDLLHRAEIATERRRPWWLRLISSSATLAADYVRARATKVADLMTQNVISATPETPLSEIALLLEKNRIKRVPILKDGRVVGIVSRANLVQAIASATETQEVSAADAAIRSSLLAELNKQPWAHTDLINVTVLDGVVSLWGVANSAAERQAIRVAAETTPGVRIVKDYLT
jgi:CBS domain-containing protein